MPRPRRKCRKICGDGYLDAHNGVSVDKDLVDEYPWIAARTGVPGWDLTDVVGADAEVAGLYGRDRLVKFLDRGRHFALRKSRFDLRDAPEIHSVVRDVKLDAIGHPDPRPHDLEETPADLSYFCFAL